MMLTERGKAIIAAIVFIVLAACSKQIVKVGYDVFLADLVRETIKEAGWNE